MKITKFCLVFLSLVLIFTACARKEYAKISLTQSVQILPKLALQENFDKDYYLQKFFSPWEKRTNKYNEKQIFWFMQAFRKNYFYYNFQPVSSLYLKQLKEDVRKNDFLQINHAGILIKNTQLYILPTKKALLKRPFADSQGLPFNLNLTAYLNYASPVLISHYSKDKTFAFIHCELGWGFVDARDIALVDENFIKKYEKRVFITPLADEEAVKSKNGDFVFLARIGAVYGINSEDENNYYSKIAGKSLVFPKKDFAPLGMKMNDKNIKHFIGEMLTQPYGWGGYEGGRDCSSFIKDLFAPFGLYLPRNSAAQSFAFKRINLAKMSNYRKLDFIKKHAIAYKTLLYLRGHIMLYVGLIDNNPAVLHEVWGLKGPGDKRYFIGRLVITRLDIGTNQSTIPHSKQILSRVLAMSFINKR